MCVRGARFKSACLGMVDCGCGNRERHGDARDRQNGHDPKHDDRTEPVRGGRGNGCGRGVAPMVEGFIASDAAGERTRPDNTERNSRQ
jgi:hypothetical protein